MSGLRLEQTRPSGHRRARGLVSDIQSGRRIEARRLLPPASLADLVESYWVGRWDLPREAPHESRLLADPSVHLVFEDGSGPHVGARVVGVWKRLWRRTLEGRGRTRGVKLRPGAVRAVLDVSAHALTGLVLPMEELLPGADALHAELGAVEDDEAALLRAGAWLEERRRGAPGVSEAIALVERVRTDPEVTTVEALAAACGHSVRQLQRVFRQHVGATPKWVIRQHRLQQVALRLERGDDRTLADLAAALGYADQAHLARDFKAAVGKSPSDFFADLSAAREVEVGSETGHRPP